MEWCSTRKHEKATADPRSTPIASRSALRAGFPLREAQGQDDRPHWDVHFHGRSFAALSRKSSGRTLESHPAAVGRRVISTLYPSLRRLRTRIPARRFLVFGSG